MSRRLRTRRKTRGGLVARVCFRATARSVGLVASRCVALRGRQDIPGVACIGTGGIHRSRVVETRRQARLHPSAAACISRIDRLFSEKTKGIIHRSGATSALLRGGHLVGGVGARACASKSPSTPTPENAETNGKTTRSRAVDLAAAKAPSPPKYLFLEFFYGFVGDTSRVAGFFAGVLRRFETSPRDAIRGVGRGSVRKSTPTRASPRVSETDLRRRHAHVPHSYEKNPRL